MSLILASLPTKIQLVGIFNSTWWLPLSSLFFFVSAEARVQNFVQQPYHNWTKFNDKVKAHSACSVHKESVLALKSFEEVHYGVQPSIDLSLSINRQRLFSTNCSRLDAIVECILLCGKQTLLCEGIRMLTHTREQIKVISRQFLSLELLETPYFRST